MSSPTGTGGTPTGGTGSTPSAPSTVTSNCYNVYPPVVAVYATPQPVVYTAFAFLFDPLTAPVKVPPIPAVKSRKKTPPAQVSAFTSVNALGTLYVTALRRTIHYQYLSYKVLDTVIQPVCVTSYTVLKVKPRSRYTGTGSRTPLSVGTYEPVAIGGSLNAVSLFASQSALTTMSNSYFTLTTTTVQFITNPSQYQALLNSLAVRTGGSVTA